MTGYTPTTDEVREAYAHDALFPAARRVEFDRWLASIQNRFTEEVSRG